MSSRDPLVTFLGAGPGGTGPLFAALRSGQADRLLGAGARWLEASPSFGGGALGSYRITSDTQASVLLEGLPKSAGEPLGDLLEAPETREVASYGTGPIPLEAAGRFLARAGESARKLVEASAWSQALTDSLVSRVEIADDGFVVHGRRGGVSFEVRSRCLVSALGGASAREEALDAVLPCGSVVRSLPLRAVCTTDELFRGGIARFADHFPEGRPAKIAVLGGSHSAYAACVKIVTRLGPEAANLQVLCRRLPKLFYPSLAAAEADGYSRPTAADVCPVTRRVFRLAGLRLQARELVRGIFGLGEAPRVGHVRIRHLLDLEPSFAAKMLAEADLVVLALGYRARTAPFFRRGERVRLLAETGARQPLVDGDCRVLLADGRPLERAFALGLASGFVPHGPMGGEPSFDGQTNGLWLYQNDVGLRVLDQVLGER